MRNRARSTAKPAPKTGKEEEDKQLDLHDQIDEFQQFTARVLPAIRKDIKSGMSAKDLRAKYAAIVQARLISDVLTTEDPSKAAAAGERLIDRVEGKPTEKREVQHTFADMKDQELDAILKSEFSELEELETKFEQ